MRIIVIVISIALLIIRICIAPSTAFLSNTIILVNNTSDTLGTAVNQDMNQTINAPTNTYGKNN